jgi:hypothetical protein
MPGGPAYGSEPAMAVKPPGLLYAADERPSRAVTLLQGL